MFFFFAKQIRQERWVQCSKKQAATIFDTHGTKEKKN